ncbi:DUF3784 domain-containing protein [Gracilibacillus sp. HCP3S3_G5_1]|uniref:DUF3784 domain-containing protein n=1 Tax=unclassified Gracilibacillus TaxID=2625209 RepID=UPI003F89A45F
MDDKMVAIIIIAACISLFVILGIVFINGKGSSLIAGYNTMSPEEQNKYDIVALSKFIGKMMFALSFSMLFWIFSVAYEMNWLFVLGLVLFIGIVIFILIYVNTGNRFKK